MAVVQVRAMGQVLEMVAVRVMARVRAAAVQVRAVRAVEAARVAHRVAGAHGSVGSEWGGQTSTEGEHATARAPNSDRHGNRPGPRVGRTRGACRGRGVLRAGTGATGRVRASPRGAGTPGTTGAGIAATTCAPGCPGAGGGV